MELQLVRLHSVRYELSFRDSGKRVSFVEFNETAGEIDVIDVQTLPSHRRKGLARVLMGHLLRRSKPVHLEVSHKNVPALSLYKDLNFSIISTRSGYYSDGSDAICMRS